MVQWYPGHMAKALREMEEKVKLVDLVMVLLDARIPSSSLNPKLKAMFNNKKILYDIETDTWLKSKSANNIWTTFKAYEKHIAGKGYAKGYLPCNARATNEYKDRTAVAYLVNRYFSSSIKIFFEGYGVKINEDAYALSEMLQFIWRSAIRDGQHITVYIPSRRMRLLLQQWIESQEYE